MGNFVDRKGQRFGRLLVVERVENDGKFTKWKCVCDCGKELSVRTNYLTNGHVSSCGCFQLERISESHYKHGLSRHRFYPIWVQMMRRCYSENHPQYRDWGGRGIRVCDEWHNVENFIKWTDKQNPSKGLQIDRENNDESYSPENCRFVSRKIQNGNTRKNVWIEYNNEKLIWKDFVDKYGVVSYSTAAVRVHGGMDYMEAALTPKKR